MSENNPIETFEVEGYIVSIYHDTEYGDHDPRNWPNTGTMACYHSRYSLGDPPKSQPSIVELEEILARPGTIALPLYLYDHSGLSMSAGKDQWPFNCPWDSGKVGYIYVTAEDIRQHWKWERITERRRAFIEEVLQREVAVYDSYLRGEIYGWTVCTKDDGEQVDSCWGYVGDYEYVKQEAADAAQETRL